MRSASPSHGAGRARRHLKAARTPVRRQLRPVLRGLRDGDHRQRQAAARFDIAPFGPCDEGRGELRRRRVLHLEVDDQPLALRVKDARHDDERRAGTQFAMKANVMLARNEHGAVGCVARGR